jgi:hypothetical protein
LGRLSYNQEGKRIDTPCGADPIGAASQRGPSEDKFAASIITKLHVKVKQKAVEPRRMDFAGHSG